MFSEIVLVCVVGRIFLRKLKDSLHIPRRLMNALKVEISDEKPRERPLCNNILSADPDGEDALLLNIRYHRVSGLSHDLTGPICLDGIGKVHNRSFYILSIYILSSLWYNVMIILIGDNL